MPAYTSGRRRRSTKPQPSPPTPAAPTTPGTIQVNAEPGGRPSSEPRLMTVVASTARPTSTPRVGATTRTQVPSFVPPPARKKRKDDHEAATMSSSTPTAPTVDSQVNKTPNGSAPVTTTKPTTTAAVTDCTSEPPIGAERKSPRPDSSHVRIPYAVFG